MKSALRSTFVQIKFFCLIIFVGIVAGLGAIFFRELIAFFHNLLFYGKISIDYDFLAYAAPSRWGVGIIFVPVVGAFFVAYLVKNFAPEAKGHGVPEVMDAIYYHQGIIRPVVALIKSLASSISIGSGGSVGREGPIIQIGSAFGSMIGQWTQVPAWQRITLIACGAGGGIAATFNAPFGGILFAFEIMLPEVAARTIIPVSLATAVATYTSYLYLGNVPFIPFQTEVAPSLSFVNIFIFVGLGVVLGVVATLFIHAIYMAEDLFERLPGGYYFQHMFGMLLVGISFYLVMVEFGHYYTQGVGYATIFDILKRSLTNPFLLFFLAGLKLIDTALTLGSGGSGGIFSPLLFIGATLGAALVGTFQLVFPLSHTMDLQLGALAGMAGIVGAATSAPLTAIIMTAELTNDFSIILPLMVIVAVAYGVRRVLVKDSVYTLKLSRRGHVIPDKLDTKPNVMKT